MNKEVLTPDDALKLHRAFLQEVLGEVMKIMGVGTASDERLITSMEVYWEACLARRTTRLAVLKATAGTPVERVIEPMGKPFQVMVRAELLPRRGEQADAAASIVYDEARSIALQEALSGQRCTARRQKLIDLIRS